MTQMIQLTMAAQVVDDDTGESIESPVPLAVDPSQIQGFHPRKHGLVGTRLMMRGGRALVVLDLYADVARKVGLDPMEAIDSAFSEVERIVHEA